MSMRYSEEDLAAVVSLIRQRKAPLSRVASEFQIRERKINKRALGRSPGEKVKVNHLQRATNVVHQILVDDL